ncbi:FxsA family protein [Bacillus sp. DTU_2020_1000418_1_SI_GHA_SEK_038]|uniref:FxsA family protein n=1 Tax=Bacillus sp. DTU_2020_1000418_1_SI_GHA_SEK_038 TaxID=3077585 RepID=UPI0028E743EB|nr:FxsA family protein [Bacillus sp. DTU_2020_1000418_1_SI_GHA_SEK_038]WNS74564.1 FxsA family protein [Bacillus sp. DTU_2020_1000418_1_SI_GHA_SEK_038]
MRYLLLLIIIVPAAEIGVLLLSGNLIGVWPTIGMIVFTGVLGAYLAKKQGLETIRRAREQLNYGRMPGEAILDGISVLIGGTLLLTPGFITDISGLLLLAPPTRSFFKKLMMKWFRKWMDKNTVTIIR